MKAMVEAVRMAEKACGSVSYEATDHEAMSRVFRRSLFVVKDMQAGEVFTDGEHPQYPAGAGVAPAFSGNGLGPQGRPGY